MRIKKLKKSVVDLTKKNEYVLDIAQKTANYLPCLCFVAVEGVVKLMLVWLWSNTLKKWGVSPELF